MNSEQKNYWKKFYNNKDLLLKPSDFAKFIYDNKIFNNKKTLLDCGCGNGRDSYYFSNKFNVLGIDSSFKPKNNKNVEFICDDFCNYPKKDFDIIYSRFTFHSITNDQQNIFLDSIPNGSYLAIETRSSLGECDNVYHGKTHYRNYTNLNYLKNLLTTKKFDILYIKEDKNFAIYKDENPICIRVICKKI